MTCSNRIPNLSAVCSPVGKSIVSIEVDGLAGEIPVTGDYTHRRRCYVETGNQGKHPLREIHFNDYEETTDWQDGYDANGNRISIRCKYG